MERDESLINGPGVQPPVSVNAPVPRDVTGDALRQGVAQVGQNAGGVFREMVETEDSTKQFEQERILMQMQDEVNLEAKRRLQLPDGDPEAFFDERGNFSQVAVKDFLNPYKKTLAGIGSGIMVPERARKMQMKAALIGDKMLGDLMDSGFEVAKQKQRKLLDSNLTLAEETNNWGWYGDTVREAVKSGAMDPAEGNLALFRGEKKATLQDFKNLSATNPDLAAEKINRGELDRYFSAAEQDEMMRSLRRQDDSRQTDLIEQAVSQPKGKSDKQAIVAAVLSGDIYEEELKFLNTYNRDGSFAASMPEIENFLFRLADDVAPGEEKDGLERKMTNLSRKCTLYQMPSDTKSRLLKRMEENAKRRAEYPKLNATEYIKNTTSGKGVKLYDPKLYNERTAGLRQQALDNYALLKDTVNTAGLPDPGKKKVVEKYISEHAGELEDELTNQTTSKVRVAFDAWHGSYKQDHGDKEPSVTLQEDQIEALLRQFTGNQSFALPGKFGIEADKAVNESNRMAEDAYTERKKSAPVLAGDQEKARSVPQRPFTFPSTVSVDTTNADAPAGILVPESMRKKYGDDVSTLAALVPVSFSSRRGRPLPVVGYTKAASPQLTLAGASKMRITFSTRMNTNVTITPAGKEMQEFFKREYFHQSAGDDGAPPQDYDLVPDNGVETAVPVSGAYLNGDLTVLPPL